MLERIRDFPNVPRKEKKFANFVRSSLNTRSDQLIARAWQAITTNAKTANATATTAANGSRPNQRAESAATNGRAEASSTTIDEDADEERSNDIEQSIAKPKLRKLIRKTLKAHDNRIKVKKLKAIVRQQLASVSDEEFETLFVEKLASLAPRVSVQDKHALLNNDQ